MRLSTWILLLLVLPPAYAYDPLDVSGKTPKFVDLSCHDAERGRDIPLRVYLPSSSGSAAVVLFSHGLGGSRETCRYLGRHWAARGYVTVMMQHRGSDETVWKGQADPMSSLKGAANLQNYMARVKDVTAVLDHLETWNREPNQVLYRRLDLEHVGMSGHSFGAQTTQAVAGQSFRGRQFVDPRIDAAIMFSPSSPRRGSAKEAFSKVRLPWMLMTGTRDIGRIGGADLESRLGVYPALPAGDKFELVLEGGEHSAFTERAIAGQQRNPNHHRIILALSTAFWDTYLGGKDGARSWLKNNGVRPLLQKGDRWQSK